MPRYIDVDKLLKKKEMMMLVKEPDNWFSVPEEENIGNYYIEVNDIDIYADENKIDAIAIGWIEKQLEDEKDFFERVYSPKHKWECQQRIYCLRDLLIKWRKENEDNT